VDTPFPCPFCLSAGVVLVGAGRHFLHYRCVNCAEVWTAHSAAGSEGRDRTAASDLSEIARKDKVLLN
jgi:hypothetical protein